MPSFSFYYLFLLTKEGGGIDSVDSCVKAVDYAIAQKVDIITSSVAYGPNTPELHAAIDRATQAGIVYVWSLHNGNNIEVIRPGYFWNSSWDVGAFDRFFCSGEPSDIEGGLSETAPQIAGLRL